MKDFGELNITYEPQAFSGEKISIQKVLNKDLVVQDWKIGPSKIAGKDFRIDIQILLGGEQRVTWTSSKKFKELVERIPKKELPFTAQIVAIDGGGFKFIPADKSN